MAILKINQNVDLKHYTTFKIGGPAKYFFLAKSANELINALKWAKKNKLKHFILGGGSNLLVPDKGFNGLVIKIKLNENKISGKKLSVGANMPLAQLVSLAAKNGLSGLEWAAGIPGTVGGAIRGNAGAFGGSMADVVKRVLIIDPKLAKKNFSNKECRFSYRDSIFKQNRLLIVLEVEIELKGGDKNLIKKQIHEILFKRSGQPCEPSAGCIFKNITFSRKHQPLLKKYPELVNITKTGLIPAAWLIDKSGLKGKKIGQIQISPKHANFIVNLGQGKARDVLRMIKLAKLAVFKKFKIKIKEEVEII
ncbi:MAG: UDP-N-acetylmuramate dehydrogenase [Patescibacteria group bacterium]|nr:UDP-N-acetylmuramate dehydrogenase [Patescibacteria group bacterium]